MTSMSDYFAKRDLMHELSDYQCAVKVLRAVADAGFQSYDEGEPTRTVEIHIGRQREPMAILLLAAMHMVDPKSNAFYNEEKGLLALEFDGAMATPPVRQVWAKMDALKERIVRRCHQDSNGNYIALRDKDIDFDICNYISNYCDAEHPACAFFRLPGKEPFTDSRGTTFQPRQLINYASFNEFAQAKPDLYDYENMPIELLSFEPATMQKMMQALGAMPQPRSRAN